MKILILAKFFLKDGASTHIFTLSEELIKNNNEVDILSAGPAQDKESIEFFKKNIPKGIRHHKIKFPNYFNYSFFSKIKQLYVYISVIPTALKKIKEINPDIIHVHYPITSYLAWIAKKRYGIPFVTTYHIKGIPKTVLHKKADAAIAISSEMKNELRERWNYNKEKIKLVFNGVSQEKFTVKISDDTKIELKKNLGIDQGEVIIGFVGTYQHKKGIDILLKSISRLKSKKYKLILLGSGDQEWLEKIVKDLNINDKVIFQPFQNPIKFYSIFDIFVLPSRNEGFPLVALESMMMGCCTIRSNVSGAYDMINDKEDGFIFENENIDELAKILDNVISDKYLREKIGKNGKNKSIENFTEKQMVEKTLRVYQNIVLKEN